MDYYFIFITVIDAFVLGILCVLTKCNETLNSHQKRWFINSFVLIIAVSVLEVISVIADNMPASYRWVNIIANYLGFGLSPAVPIFLVFSLESNKNAKKAIIAEFVYLLLLAASLPFKIIFYIDRNNHYTRERFFWIYVIVYSAGLIYLLVSTLLVVRKYQNRSRDTIYLITAFLLVCTSIQVLFPKIHTSWLSITLLSILYYTYCNGMWQQLDELTGLLNQNSYLNKTLSLSQNVTLIVFDIDDFKQVNDNYGHLAGDRCLKEISDCIKKAYSKNGLCYRIGGDEFCVLLNADADKESCNKMLMRELNIKREKWNILPSVSFGSAPFTAGDDILNAKELADNAMYQMKKAHKASK